jgi:5-methylcytosine-specific restriction endonuclease McrA
MRPTARRPVLIRVGYGSAGGRTVRPVALRSAAAVWNSFSNFKNVGRRPRRADRQVSARSAWRTPSAWPAASPTKSSAGLDTRQRNCLLKVAGYGSYAASLQSPLWASKREQVIREAHGRCKICGQPATQVHHRVYSERNLLRYILKRLGALCGRCHYRTEIDRGETNSLGRANHKLMLKRKWRKKASLRAKVRR